MYKGVFKRGWHADLWIPAQPARTVGARGVQQTDWLAVAPPSPQRLAVLFGAGSWAVDLVCTWLSKRCR